MITFNVKGDLSRTKKFLNRILHLAKIGEFDKYGKIGVQHLKNNTPTDTGDTAASWYYDVKFDSGRVTIEWHNDNIVDGVPVAILLQYGHKTKNGGYVQGIDFINPSMKPVFKSMADDLWKEVISK